MSARDAEILLKIPASTIRTWHQRRARTGLYPVGQHRGQLLFREQELVQLRDGKRRINGRPSDCHGDLGRHLTAGEAQELLGIPSGTVRAWHHREDSTGLYRAGLDSQGRPLFHEIDLIALRKGWVLRDDEGERIHTMDDLRKQTNS